MLGNADVEAEKIRVEFSYTCSAIVMGKNTISKQKQDGGNSGANFAPPQPVSSSVYWGAKSNSNQFRADAGPAPAGLVVWGVRRHSSPWSMRLGDGQVREHGSGFRG
jgi:hypothetical protein